MDYVWEILRYVAAWGGTGLIIWFWYWMFSNIGRSERRRRRGARGLTMAD